MSTRASLIYPKEGEGSWGFYLELLDDTVHFEINAAGVQVDIELMPLAQWTALGFPNRFAVQSVKAEAKPVKDAIRKWLNAKWDEHKISFLFTDKDEAELITSVCEIIAAHGAEADAESPRAGAVI